jgi:hypothetical protein
VRTTTSTATSTDSHICPVCRAPEVELHRRCAFCGSEIESAGDGGPNANHQTEMTGLLDYLATCLPSAQAGRGMLGKGPVKELRVGFGAERYQARLRKDGVELLPSAEPAAWIDMLVASLTEAAAGDRELRAALSRAGWAWR